MGQKSNRTSYVALAGQVAAHLHTPLQLVPQIMFFKKLNPRQDPEYIKNSHSSATKRQPNWKMDRPKLAHSLVVKATGTQIARGSKLAGILWVYMPKILMSLDGQERGM